MDFLVNVYFIDTSSSRADLNCTEFFVGRKAAKQEMHQNRLGEPSDERISFFSWLLMELIYKAENICPVDNRLFAKLDSKWVTDCIDFHI